jgi:hypothetical protein
VDKIYFDMQSQALFLETIGRIGSLVPLVVAIACSFVWWKRLLHPRFSLVMATLALYGLYDWLRWSAYMVQMLAQPSFLEKMEAPARRVWFEIIATGGAGVLTVILGVLLLRAAMRLQARPSPLGSN